MNLECTEPPKQPHTFKALPTDAPLKTYLAFVKSQNALSYDELKNELMKLMSEYKKLPLSLLVMHALAGDQDIRLHEDGTDTKQFGEAVKKHVQHTLDQQNGVILSQEQIQILDNGVKTDWLNALSAAQLSSLHNHLEEAMREQNDKVSSFLLENILEPSEEPQITAQKQGFQLMIQEPLFQQMLKKLDSSKPLSEWKTFFTTQRGSIFYKKCQHSMYTKHFLHKYPFKKLSSVGRRMGIDIIETCEPLLFFAALARNISKEQIKPLIKALYTLVNPASKMPIIERNDPYFNQITPCNNMMKYIPPTHSFIVASKGPGEPPAAIITSAQDHQNKINMIRDDIEKRVTFFSRPKIKSPG